MDFEKIIKNIPVVNDNVNYWIVRANGGKLYNQFLSNKKIAMGSNYITPEKIKSFPIKKEDFLKTITPIIKPYIRPEILRRTATDFYTFYHELKENDIVIIPNESNQKLSIGQVLDSEPTEFVFKQTKKNESTCDRIHSVSVKWLTEKSIYKLNNPHLISLLCTAQNEIKYAGEYKNNINCVLYDFFIQEKTGYFIINVNTKKSIEAKTFFKLFAELFELTEKFPNGNFSKDDINLRVNLNSPGQVILSSKDIKKLIVLGMILVSFSGGKLRVMDLEIDINGIAPPIINLIDTIIKEKGNRASMQSAYRALGIERNEIIYNYYDENIKLLDNNKNSRISKL